MHLVKFIRSDWKPEEIYCYHNKVDAENHFYMFEEDDSKLYVRIELLELSGGKAHIIDYIYYPELDTPLSSGSSMVQDPDQMQHF